jgi:hypothetical protein
MERVCCGSADAAKWLGCTAQGYRRFRYQDCATEVKAGLRSIGTNYACVAKPDFYRV